MTKITRFNWNQIGENGSIFVPPTTKPHILSETIKSQYKIPLHKVLGILERGRNNWKAKYTEIKSENKYLRTKLRRSEQRQQAWKQKAQAAVLENKRLQTLFEQSRGLEVEILEKKRSSRDKALR